MMSARRKTRAVKGTTLAIFASSLTCRCQSSGAVSAYRAGGRGDGRVDAPERAASRARRGPAERAGDGERQGGHHGIGVAFVEAMFKKRRELVIFGFLAFSLFFGSWGGEQSGNPVTRSETGGRRTSAVGRATARARSEYDVSRSA